MSDNGASQEGGPRGMVNYSRYFNGRPETIDESMASIDQIGTPYGFNNYPWGWAQVGNTPGKRYKQNTHGGGIRDPLIIHWPKGVPRRAASATSSTTSPTSRQRSSRSSASTKPDVVNGVPQMPTHGTSLAYSFPPKRRPRRPPSRCSISRCSAIAASGPTAGRR